MKKKIKHICLVTPAHLSTNPRLIKEADALTEAGYKVSIVSARFMSWSDEADREFEGRNWSVKKLEYGIYSSLLKKIHYRLRRKISRFLVGLFGPIPGMSERAIHSIIPELTSATCSISADLYIAHNLAALPAAYKAAHRNNSLLGFDAEDFHSGELVLSPNNILSILLARDIEKRYLPHCDYITAASPGIAKMYSDLYNIETPTVILNVFPVTNLPSNCIVFHLILLFVILYDPCFILVSS
jgi:hypothetical protein